MSSHLADGARRVVITMDNYETFGLVDTWLRQTLLPALPSTSVTLIGGRIRPGPGWATDPGWAEVFRETELRALDEAQSIKMLCSRGLSEEQARRINGFTRGHPLALELAAAAGRAHPDLHIEEAAIPHVVERLTELFLSGLDADTVEALEASSTVRRVTEPLLASMLDSPSRREGFEAMRSLSFVSAMHDGLVLHDVMRDTISYGLAQRDPARHAKYRRRALRHLTDATSRSTKTVWQYTADLLYLVRNPLVHNAFFHPEAIDISMAPSQPGDHDAIREICIATEPKESARWLVRWLDRHPETFMVARTALDRVAGFYILFEPGRVDSALLHEDPMTAAWCAHLEAHPVLPHERVLFNRRWLTRDIGEALGPVTSACWLDLKRTYMELRPHLRRVYGAVMDIASIGPVVTPLGFVAVDEAHRKLGESMYYAALLDFGPGSIDGWLGRMVGMELGADPDVHASPGEAPPASPIRYLRWINASKGTSVRLVGIEEISYFRSDTKYTRVVAAGGEWLISKTIKELVDELDPSMFLQMHRSTIVNLNAVESVDRDMSGHVVLRLKNRTELLPVSQPYTHLFRQM
ncbi:MAG TPA: LytTR family DNA-binding domain-containing protein [Usitatibacter sp.]|nr:LytTR family DNA-binding domain-containing protein [Usitatibacter sp.]